MQVKLLCVAGARPNFMKLAPLFRAFGHAPWIEPLLVHTGQHYDDRMSGQFFRDLGLPEPHHHLAVGSGSHAQQTAEILRRFEPVLLSERPDAVLVVGDVNSTAACALVAKKLHCQVIHVEAGLRSFDRSMPEEINRLVTDAIADLFLVTEESAMRNLEKEGVPEDRVYFVGNLMIDSLHYHLPAAREAKIVDEFGLRGQRFGVVTLHRPANVDDKGQLAGILSAVEEIAREIPLVFPVHPRSRGMLPPLADGARLRLTDPLGYLDFLSLLSQSAVVLTDSGGIQEETTALGIPCLTLRDNTERPITVEQGTNRLAGTTREGILRAWNEAMREASFDGPRKPPPRFWDGRAAQRCVAAIEMAFASRLAPASAPNADAPGAAPNGIGSIPG